MSDKKDRSYQCIGRGNGLGFARGTLVNFLAMREKKYVPTSPIAFLSHATVSILPRISEACGVVCINGGLSSHLAIICLELGIPFVTLCGQATRFTVGDEVFVDSHSGAVSCVSHRAG